MREPQDPQPEIACIYLHAICMRSTSRSKLAPRPARASRPAQLPACGRVPAPPALAGPRSRAPGGGSQPIEAAD